VTFTLRDATFCSSTDERTYPGCACTCRPPCPRAASSAGGQLEGAAAGWQLPHLPRRQASGPGSRQLQGSATDFTVQERLRSVLRIRDVYLVYPGSRIRIKGLSILTQKIVSKLSEILSRLFIPDPDPDFFTYPESRGKKGTGSLIRIRNTD
jgi:hypothetical protein